MEKAGTLSEPARSTSSIRSVMLNRITEARLCSNVGDVLTSRFHGELTDIVLRPD